MPAAVRAFTFQILRRHFLTHPSISSTACVFSLSFFGGEGRGEEAFVKYLCHAALDLFLPSLR
jgi:hypothetical protein